ncbi:glycosyltransferase [Intrasporangium sp.]|uniref:glycosyltransferase family protein n=1 Tax=Intrasporangium sp. TaxID=1925024 RepID=UPI00293A139D|nr:glycosyltransferase [Intrasporangium sp.]MDV3219807.1 glycosyltransferase [Intrasporangium sp.]
MTSRNAGLRRELDRATKAVREAMSDSRARGDLPRKLRKELHRRVPALRPKIRLRTSLPHVVLPTGPIVRPEIRAAVILDPFSSLALRYEWDQVDVLPDAWRDQLTSPRLPDLLFVESAWNGNDGAWRLAMTSTEPIRDELLELVEWCRGQGVPTVFWNKEDPPNYERFIETARWFDHVFTVDADRLPDYRRDLGHDRVGLLPFAAQPRLHNPVLRDRGREHDVAFAGTYFADKHEQRRAQMDTIVRPALEHGLHIYSRMALEDERYQFPPEYRSSVVGSLPYERMLAAYTSYKVFLNVNSVTTSPTMCARRLFELSAAQTPVLSGPAASIEPFFGDTITVARDAEEARSALSVLLRHAEYRDRIGLRAHRRVFDEHLYRHRVSAVLESVGHPASDVDQSITAVVPTMRPDRLDSVLDYIAEQSHGDVELVLVTHGFEADPADVARRAADRGMPVPVLRSADASITLGACMNLGVEAASGRYVAKMDDDNVYAAHYLRDLVRAFEYTEAVVVGKWAHYAHLSASGATLLRFPDAEHRYVSLVQGGTILVPREVAAKERFEDLPRRVDTTFLEKIQRAGGKVYSADRFNFVSMRSATTDGHTWPITDMELLARRSELAFYGDATTHVTV